MAKGTTDAIRAALKGKTTGLTGKEIREAAGLEKVGSALVQLVNKGEVIKHKGEGRNDARYSLNPEHLADAPSKAGRKGKKKTRKAATPPAPQEGQARRPQARAAGAVRAQLHPRDHVRPRAHLGGPRSRRRPPFHAGGHAGDRRARARPIQPLKEIR